MNRVARIAGMRAMSVASRRVVLAGAPRVSIAGTVQRTPNNMWASAIGAQVRGFASTFLPEAEVAERVINVVKGFDKVDQSKLTEKAHFINDLGLDSLDTVEVIMAVEEEFVIEIPDDMAEKLLTVEDAVKFVSQHPQAQ
mmetsp:Transcript_19584/g.34866  ORF Transcript_19584/g.34866 Transcript_19584/m.34866 type:complete len:140 (+) Transcript_19584:133-552(+)|eukprot:CAMPEP_0184518836 /NCGR_PEP_ID=MMETSP0198_2-20121128/6295_1 /TAXON_ID=1112570 /ORGANISM="Thraustochytrium sp., Strain LLF1b" /LENGTH=139 /DNA_ID=CAMNT_0026909291 /DNA_START=131 /DNA_END=550 /DNA_ORIENTATION=+